MFNIFKKSTEQTSNEEASSKPDQFKSAVDANTPIPEKKKVHGEDGVCCGSCGGE